MDSNKMKLIIKIGIVFLLLSICGLISWNFYSGMENWVYYDSEEYALEEIDNTIEAAYLSQPGATQQESLPSCGGSWFPDECWELLQVESKASGGSFQVINISDTRELAEDQGFPVWDVAEFYVEVMFNENRNVFINVYEGCFNYCYLIEDSGN